jgi:hypothetical protein
VAGSPNDPLSRWRKNVRTALALASVAAVFFIGIVIKYKYFT